MNPHNEQIKQQIVNLFAAVAADGSTAGAMSLEAARLLDMLEEEVRVREPTSEDAHKIYNWFVGARQRMAQGQRVLTIDAAMLEALVHYRVRMET